MVYDSLVKKRKVLFNISTKPILQNKNTGSPMSVVSRVFHKNVSKMSALMHIRELYVSNFLSLTEWETMAASAAKGWGRVPSKRWGGSRGIQTQRGMLSIMKYHISLYATRCVIQVTRYVSRVALQKLRIGFNAKVSR